MKSLWLVIALMAGFIVNVQVTANDDFNSGMNYAKGLKGKELDTFKSFKPADNLPDYSRSPDATNYYGGVQSSGTDLTSPGRNRLNSTGWGKTVTDSVSKQPTDMVTADSPFLDNGRNAENNAETVFDPRLCESREFERSVFTNYVCDRDLQIQQYCTRTAMITGDWGNATVSQSLTVNAWEIPFSVQDRRVTGTYTFPVSGTINRIRYSYGNQRGSNTVLAFTAFGGQFDYAMNRAVTGAQLSTPLRSVTAGQQIELSHSGIAGLWDLLALLPVQFTLDIDVPGSVWRPRVAWAEYCPFSKTEGALTHTICTEAGGDKTVYQNGKPYTVHQDCWAYKDTYLTQSPSEGTCSRYLHNPACNVVNQRCADTVEGVCLHANITYSCESKIKGEGKVCGDTLFCTDGSCVQAGNNKNNMFGQAASELAAVAAAGKDVAGFKGRDVKIFTGKAMSCKKFAAGFSNCCQDSGWGQSVGLSRCNSDEKALGKAKEKRLTAYVGEYCSSRVLGVCIEKKRGYCVFGSKLAQIVQQQGRAWQLGIGFGSGDSPECRGISPEELQKIDFSKVDFSAFYDDLNSGSDIPADNNQMEKMKVRMKAMFEQGSSH